jgi:hypothetical protein
MYSPPFSDPTEVKLGPLKLAGLEIVTADGDGVLRPDRGEEKPDHCEPGLYDATAGPASSSTSGLMDGLRSVPFARRHGERLTGSPSR